MISVYGSNNTEARHRRDTASYVRSPDDKYSMRHRAEDYRRGSSSRPLARLIVSWFSFIFLLSAEGKHPAGREQHDPTLTSSSAPIAYKVMGAESCQGDKQIQQLFNNRSRRLA